MIKKRWAKSGSPLQAGEEDKFFKELNKGDAAAIITRMKHGAQVCFECFSL